MKIKNCITVLFLFFLLASCNSYRYIYEPDSQQRQKELFSQRSTNVGCDILGFMSSAFISAICNSNFNYLPSPQQLKILKIINPTIDTMYVTMLTDATWKTEEYCDFNDVRIPPLKRWKLLVPIGINYNLYFGNTDNPENDELLEINTSRQRKIILQPATTNSEKSDE